MKIDILVVSYHAKNELAQCLASLALYSAPDYRLTVHDNTAVNYPLTWLWNRFAERSRAEFVAFVNSDVIVGPGWDTEAFALMKADPQVANASPLSNYPPHRGLASIRKPDKDAFEWLSPLTETLKQNPKRFHKGTDRTLVSGHCMILRRAAFRKVGGFDEQWSFANNDWDMNQRLVKAGYSLGVCLHAVSLHWINASTKDAISKGLTKGNPVFVKPLPGATFDSIGCSNNEPAYVSPRMPRRAAPPAAPPAHATTPGPGIIMSPAAALVSPGTGNVNSRSVTPIKH